MIRSKPMQCTCDWQRRTHHHHQHRHQQQQFNHKSNTTLFSVSRKSVFKWKAHTHIYCYCHCLLTSFVFRFSSSSLLLSLSLIIVFLWLLLSLLLVLKSLFRLFVFIDLRLFIWWHLKFVVGLGVFWYDFTIVCVRLYLCSVVDFFLSLSLTQISPFHSPFTRYTFFSNENNFFYQLSIYLTVSSHLFITLNRSLFILYYLSFNLYLSFTLSLFLSALMLFLFLSFHTRAYAQSYLFSVFRVFYGNQSSNIVFHPRRRRWRILLPPAPLIEPILVYFNVINTELYNFILNSIEKAQSFTLNR